MPDVNFCKKGFIVFSILMLLNSIAFAQNNILDKKITLTASDIPLSRVLTELTKQTGFRFTFGNTIDLSQNVSTSFSDIPFKDLLDQLLNPLAIKWELVENQIALSPGKKKCYKLQGIVQDSTEKSPIQFAVIGIKGNSLNTSTDFNGKFIFPQLSPGTYTVSVYAFGYRAFSEIVQIQNRPVEIIVDLPKQNIVLEETIVVSDKIIEHNSVSEMQISSSAIEAGKGIANDPMNSISALPGILGKMDVFGFQDIHIRGGEGFENQFLLDNITMPYPFYYFGPSVFNSEILEKAEVLTGGYGPNYGNSMSSIFNLTTKNGDPEKYSGGFDLNILTRTGFAQGPIIKNKLSFIVSSRSTNLDFLVAGLSPKVESFSMSDFTSKLTYSINAKNKISLTDIFVTEKLDFTDSAAFLPGLKNKNGINAQNLQLQSIIGEKAYSKISLLYSSKNIDSRLDSLFNSTANTSVGFRDDISFYPNPKNKLKLGVEANFESEKSDKFEFYKATDISITDSTTLLRTRNIDTTNITSALYFYYDGILFKRLLVNAGLRFDYTQLNDNNDISPRITLGYQLSKSTILSASWGVFSQKPTNFELIQNLKLKSNQCQHTILSLKQKLSKEIIFKAEAYYKDYTQLVIFDSAFIFSNSGYGITKGLEFMVSREAGRFNGWISYALAKSDRRRNLQDKIYPYYFDQRHSINVALNYSIKNKHKVWIIPNRYSIDFRYSTGAPYTPITGIDSLSGKYKFVTGAINSSRNPEYNNLNIKIEWLGTFGKKKKHLAEFYINIWNIYSQSNVIERVYSLDPSDHSLSVKKLYAAKFFPNFGVKLNFNHF